MAELILSLIPLAIAAALQPADMIALVMLLQTQRGVTKGFAFIAGMITFRLVLGGTFWVLLSRVEEKIETADGKFDIFVGSVLVVLGLLLLVYALRRSLSARSEEEVAASWLDKLNDASPLRVALMGFILLTLDPKDWLVDISAVDLIVNADLSGQESLLAYLVYILLAQSLLLIPLIYSLIAPQHAQRNLAALNTRMRKHERSIEIIVAVMFGLLFLFIGLEHLSKLNSL